MEPGGLLHKLSCQRLTITSAKDSSKKLGLKSLVENQSGWVLCRDEAAIRSGGQAEVSVSFVRGPGYTQVPRETRLRGLGNVVLI